jgi:hypothetical protein
MNDKTIPELVRKNETDYATGNTAISKYVNFSLGENISKIDAYLNSKHISGDTDSMGRDKPFFNIVTAAVNIWFRATDIDRKNIKVKPTKASDTTAAFLATLKLQEWMRKERFGRFLNDWGMTLARYGSAVVKFIESGGELHPMVVPWNRLIVDAVNFDNDVVIEVLELTPAQLRKKKGYDQEIVEKLIDTAVSRETLDKQKKDSKNNFIKVYEVHGELPLSLISGKDSDEDTYVQQMQVISFVASKEGEYDDFCLVKGREAKNPYMITHLIEEDGRTQSIGAVEHLFESQWMVNHTAKQIKDQLDLASKLIFQTSDGNFIGQNALSAIESGDILVHKVNEPLTQLANNSHDITSLQNYGSQWKALGNEITGVSESMMGTAAPSGTAWRQVEALLQENHSLFEIMTENKGLHIEDMLRIYVLPFIKKQLDNKEEITASLEANDIKKIDSQYVPFEATKRLGMKLINSIIEDGEFPEVDDDMRNKEVLSVRAELDAQGNRRFFVPSEFDATTWKEVFKDLEWELEVDITGEQRDNANDMATLATVFQTIAAKQGVPMSPEERMLFNKIITVTGSLSPIEIAETQAQTQPLAPTVGAVGSGGAPVAPQPTQ